MSIDLNLPPGHRLLAAPGVDSAPGSWVSQWQLLDFFLLLIVTIATARLFGNAAAAAALLALVLSLHETDSAAWTWLNLLAAVALVRVAPQGRFMAVAKAYRTISAVLLVVILVPFAVVQIRDAIYPQLEQRAGSFYGIGQAQQDVYPASAPVAYDAAMKMESSVTREAEAPQEIVVTGTRASKSYSRYADNAIVQAGPGRPSWEWNEYRLDFSGPVDPGRTMRLVIVPDWLLSLLRLLQVLAIAAFRGGICVRNPRPKSGLANTWRTSHWQGNKLTARGDLFNAVTAGDGIACRNAAGRDPQGTRATLAGAAGLCTGLRGSGFRRRADCGR